MLRSLTGSFVQSELTRKANNQNKNGTYNLREEIVLRSSFSDNPRRDERLIFRELANFWDPLVVFPRKYFVL